MTGATLSLTPEDLAWIERWAARAAFVERVRAVQARHPYWTAVEIIIELERRRVLVLLDQPPGRYLVNRGTRNRPSFAPLADARRAIACALSAVAAARGLDPRLVEPLAPTGQHLEAASRDLGKVQP